MLRRLLPYVIAPGAAAPSGRAAAPALPPSSPPQPVCTCQLSATCARLSRFSPDSAHQNWRLNISRSLRTSTPSFYVLHRRVGLSVVLDRRPFFLTPASLHVRITRCAARTLVAHDLAGDSSTHYTRLGADPLTSISFSSSYSSTFS